VRAVDAVFMLRPCTREMVEGAQAAKDFGRPLIVDYDDDLLDIPRDNPSYSLFAVPEIQSNVKQFLAAADCVATSTDYLGSRLAQKSKRVETICNAYDPHLDKFLSDKPTNKSILWRGTETHHRDIASVAIELVEAAARHPEYLFIFMGNDPAPWAVSERIKNVMRIGKLDLMHYFKSISALRPRAVVTPLADTSFNRGKSNIAAIEAAFAGAPCIAPQWKEWLDVGALTYGPDNSFRDRLEQVIESDKDRDWYAAEAWQNVREKYSLEAANEKRVALVRELVG
jgi:glycosyltransferase involved in cell wall biosynthesis